MFATLFDHMPVYTAEPSAAERAAAAVLLDRVSAPGSADAPAVDVLDAVSSSAVPAPRLPAHGECISA